MDEIDFEDYDMSRCMTNQQNDWEPMDESD